MISSFNYTNEQLWCEDLPITELAKEFGTPSYIYSRKALEHSYLDYANSLTEHDALVCYAVKANSNLAVLNVLARLGAGFDIVSQGELERVLRAGGEPDKIVFSGVGKQEQEILRALEVGIYCFNIESESELELINKLATRIKKTAKISFRVNPDVDAGTHPYISTGLKENKFGIDIGTAPKIYQRATELEYISIQGVDCHIGSQLTELEPLMDALDRLLELIEDLKTQGINIKHVDLGGGLGVCYKDETPPSPQQYMAAVLKKLANKGLKLIVEPGRSIAANAGILLTKVELLKHNSQHNFAVVDAAMNDLIRPALYAAYQDIMPVIRHTYTETKAWDIVGPVCETGDFFGKGRELSLQPDDLLAVCSAGAYGFVMASNYNSRNKPAEIMVDGNQSYLIRRRETLDDQLRGESLLPIEECN